MRRKMKNKSPRFFVRPLIILPVLLLFLSFFVSAAVITPVTFNGTSVTKGYPSVDGNYLVWSDDREGGMYATFLYFLNNGTETQISPATSFDPQNPRVSGSLVAYQDNSAGEADIFVYDISSGNTLRITDDPMVPHIFPAISGNRIVWMDYRDDPLSPKIYANGTSPGSEAALSLSVSDQDSPAMYGDLVVWQDNRNANWDIYLYNLTSNEEIQVTDDGNDQTNPAIYGNRIVWTDSRNTPSEIYINGTSPGSEYSLTPDGPADNCITPSIHGSKVVWRQGDTSIYMNDTSLASGSLIPVDTLPGSYPADKPDLSYDPVYGDRVVWLETSSHEIYLSTSGSSDACPVANFTHDFTGGAAPVAVHFTDQSVPAGASYWLWDFGDGTSSRLQNPSHQYTDNISYQVSLVTGNPSCRNMTVETDSVVVGRPVADFTASPTSDIVPAIITFTDRSSGSPDTWLWDFGDGTSSTVQNPVHTYTVPGTYTVTMTATNAFGSSERTRAGYINALNGANIIANTSIDGLSITNCGGPQTITVDTLVLTASLAPNTSVLEITPPVDSGFSTITVYSFDGVGFADAGNVITGNVTGVHLETRGINPRGFSETIGGSRITVSYAADLASYPCNALLRTVIWENAVAADNASFQKIALGSNFAHYSGTAYTTRITKTNFPEVTSARFRMSVDAGWIASFTDGRNQTYIERISDDRTVGEVLDTRFVSHDAVNNVDYFEAESPRGLSTFGLSALSGSGNPFQLITLSVTSHVNPPAQELPSSDSDSGMPGGGGGGIAPAKIIVPTTMPTPALTPQPPDPGTSAKVYTNPQGVVSQATRLVSTDGRAEIILGEGIVAKDAAGKPLEQITMRAIPAGSLPPVPSGSAFTFAGMAYEIGPDSATFLPPGAVTFKLSQAQWGLDYTVRSFDHKTGTWVDLPTTLDAVSGTVTVEVSHFCCFALFTSPVTGPPTPVATLLPVPAAPQVKAQPPTTAVSIFMSMIGWAADLMVNNAIVLAGVLILIIAVYFVRQGRFPGSGQ
jgi:beta propeller repeat protein